MLGNSQLVKEEVRILTKTYYTVIKVNTALNKLTYPMRDADNRSKDARQIVEKIYCNMDQVYTFVRDKLSKSITDWDKQNRNIIKFAFFEAINKVDEVCDYSSDAIFRR